MAQRGHGAYSRFIGFAKIGLPLTALVLLATVFLVTNEDDIFHDSLVTQEMLEELGETLEIVGPRFSGNTAAGEAYLFSAERVVPDAAQPTEVSGVGLDGYIDFAEGGRMSFSAPEAHLNVSSHKLSLSGGIVLRSSDGSELTASAVSADLEAGVMESHGEVKGTSPMGEMSADHLRIEPQEGGQMLIWLEGNVRLSFDVAESDEGAVPE